MRVMNHGNYDVVNGEWRKIDRVGEMWGRSLRDYMFNELELERDECSWYWFVDCFYLRSCYGVGYYSCSGEVIGGVSGQRYLNDPWNRQFVVNVGRDAVDGSEVVVGVDVGNGVIINHFYKMYYSSKYDAYNKGVGNVVLYGTSVHGRMVYCLDVMYASYAYV